MTAFTPEVGDVFYMECRPIDHVVDNMDGTITKYQTQDRSYHDVIFRCVAADHVCIVAERLTRSFFDGPQLFKKTQYLFEPVGPEVLKAMGINLEDKTGQ